MRKQLLVSLVFVLGGCLGDPSMTGGGNGPGGSGGAGGGGGTGGNPDSPGGGGTGTGGGVPMGACGQATFPVNLNKTAPNVMLVVDESGSMKEQVPGSNMSKWQSLQAAVHTLLGKYDGSAQWGLSIFPKAGGGGNSCTPGGVDIPVAPNTATQILGMLDGLTDQTIGGNTPTDQTLQAVLSSGSLHDPSHNNYVLLMTDGLPNCGSDGNGVQSTIGKLYATVPSVRTYVVGIGDGTQSDPTTLDGWATAGHTARPTSPLYYQANNVMDLTNAFADILAGVASCTYQLGSTPTDPTLLVGYIDGTAVSSNDPTNGMTYDAGSTSVTFHGTACDKIKSGAATKVDVLYGCPSPPIQ